MNDNSAGSDRPFKELHHCTKIAENIPGIVFHFDAESFTLPYVCNNLEETFGLAAEDIENNPSALLNLIEQPSQSMIAERVTDAAGEQRPLDFSVRAKTLDGSRCYRVKASPLLEDGKLYYIGVALDVTSEREYREELERTKNRLEKILASVAEAVFVVGPDHRVISTACNAMVREILGYEPEELIGETTEKLHVNHRMFKEFGRTSESALQETGYFETEWQMQRKDGTIIDTHHTITALDPEEGWQGGVVSVVRDITEWKSLLRQQEETVYELRERIKELNCLYELSGFVAAHDMSIEDLLQGAVNLLPDGWQYPDITCARIVFDGQEFITDGFQETEWRQSASIVISGETRGSVEVCYSEEKAEADDGPFLNEEGRLLDEIARRLSLELGRKEAEDALRDSEARYRSLVNTVPAVTYTAEPDEEATTIFVSPQIEDLIGFSVEEFKQNPDLWSEQVHPDDRDRVLSKIRQARDAGRPYACEYRMHCRDGDVIWIRDQARFVLDDAGEALCLQGVMLDITEAKQKEKELEEAKRRLEETLEELRQTQSQMIDHERREALTQMASGVAHDFNNALSTILGFTDLLLQSEEKLQDEDTARRYLELMNKAASKAAGTVRRMRKFYQPREEATFTSFDLNSVVEEAVSLTTPRWREQARARSAEIEVEKDFQELDPVLANEPELHDLLTNLIFNAVDAMPSGGTLTLRTRQEGESLLLEVSDTGMGMSENQRKNCLTPFFSTKEEMGSGLGLAVVRGIVDRHDGKMEVHSERGEGTTFRIRLPVAPQTEKGNNTRPAEKRTQKLKILVVEDDPAQCELIQEYLQLDDHSVDIAGDGEEGLEKFRQRQYDLVITDRSIPGVGGDHVAREVKETAPDVAVVMLTGFGDVMESLNETPMGVDLVLSKPVTFFELRNAISQVTGGTEAD